MTCWLLGVFYSLRRWMHVGLDRTTVSGHSFMEAELETDTRIEDRHAFLVEVQWLVCERCGKREHYWTPYYGSA